jgi:two-component system, chemotaxis family, CheB/CheR fusion protein
MQNEVSQSNAAPINNGQERSFHRLDHYVVGIGASAGGLEAIHDLFDNIPQDTNFSFVIIQHLSPDYKSLMAELLSKHTKMQVLEADEGMLVKPNCVYVIPNKKLITIRHGKLRLTEKNATNAPNTAIDTFFESLAEDKGNKVIAIILSGTGTDGSRGIEAIKKNGGLVVVQDPATAKFDGMPNSAERNYQSLPIRRSGQLHRRKSGRPEPIGGRGNTGTGQAADLPRLYFVQATYHPPPDPASHGGSPH